MEVKPISSCSVSRRKYLKKNLGPILVLPWSYLGPTLILPWSYLGPTLVLLWSYLDPTLVLPWSYLGPIRGERTGTIIVQKYEQQLAAPTTWKIRFVLLHFTFHFQLFFLHICSCFTSVSHLYLLLHLCLLGWNHFSLVVEFSWEHRP